VQPRGIGGRPAYVTPSTSGLNARTSPAELADHLATALALPLGDFAVNEPSDLRVE
jgi:hypothetical protein